MPGLHLRARAAAPADHAHFARLFPELGTGDPLMPADRWAEAVAPASIFFEDEAGAVVAYAYFQILSGTGYVRHVVVDPAMRGRGAGGAVMAELAARLRAAGCSRWCLNVKPDNEPAIRLYRAFGMAPSYLSTALRFGWEVVARLPRGERVVSARRLDPSEDAAVEAAFGMPAGQITDSRRRPDLVLLRLVDPAAPDEARVGFASYDPHFPGAFPFRVADPTLAAPLIEAIRPHELPDAPYVQVLAEDEGVGEALIAAGATVRLKALHMKGEVPAGPGMREGSQGGGEGGEGR